MKNKLLYLLMFLTINSIFAQTHVSGGLFSDTTWDINGSPYVVIQDVALYPGYTLTIDPGVTVFFWFREKIDIKRNINRIRNNRK